LLPLRLSSARLPVPASPKDGGTFGWIKKLFPTIHCCELDLSGKFSALFFAVYKPFPNRENWLFEHRKNVQVANISAAVIDKD
jgi:hypothetical protein